MRKKPLSELEEDASGLKSNIKLWIETNAKEGASSNQGRPQSRQSVPLGPETPKLTVMIGKSANIPTFPKELTKIQNVATTPQATTSTEDPSMMLLNTIAQQNAAQEAKKQSSFFLSNTREEWVLYEDFPQEDLKFDWMKDYTNAEFDFNYIENDFNEHW